VRVLDEAASVFDNDGAIVGKYPVYGKRMVRPDGQKSIAIDSKVVDLKITVDNGKVAAAAADIAYDRICVKGGDLTVTPVGQTVPVAGDCTSPPRRRGQFHDPVVEGVEKSIECFVCRSVGSRCPPQDNTPVRAMAAEDK
jgi:hypothetical protein